MVMALAESAPTNLPDSFLKLYDIDNGLEKPYITFPIRIGMPAACISHLQ